MRLGFSGLGVSKHSCITKLSAYSGRLRFGALGDTLRANIGCRSLYNKCPTQQGPHYRVNRAHAPAAITMRRGHATWWSRRDIYDLCCFRRGIHPKSLPGEPRVCSMTFRRTAQVSRGLTRSLTDWLVRPAEPLKPGPLNPIQH